MATQLIRYILLADGGATQSTTLFALILGIFNTICQLFAGYMRGLEKIWIVGDTFYDNSFEQHYKNVVSNIPDMATTSNRTKDNPHYAFKNYEVCCFSNNQYDSFYRSPAGRIRNSFIKAINEHNTLPNLIVVILDMDLGQKLIASADETLQLHTLASWLVNEFEKILTTYKDMLLQQAKHTDLPQILWITLPTHCHFTSVENWLRSIQSQCLDEIVHTKNGMCTLSMVKIWNHNDFNNFLKDSQCFTAEGLDRYWSSVDSAIRYWDLIVYSKILAASKKKNLQYKPQIQPTSRFTTDKFHWKRRLHTSHRGCLKFWNPY